MWWIKRRHPDLNRGIEVLQTSALPLGYGALREPIEDSIRLDLDTCEAQKRSEIRKAGNGTRTRDNHLGKVELYQLSYSRVATISRGNISSFSRVSISFFSPSGKRNW
jgi:hypothetical protein